MMKRATNAAVADAATTGTQPLTTAKERPDLDTMTKGQLFDFAETIEVMLDSTWPRADCVKALRLAMAAKAGFAGIPKTPEKSVQAILIDCMNSMLDQNRHVKPPAINTWSCCAPADKVRLFLIDFGLPADVFKDGAELVSFLRAPANLRKLREAQVQLSFPPAPWVDKTLVLIRVERAENPNSYRPLDQ
jgi:hypothetical protein